MQSKCRVGGHPLHPILVSFPVALFTTSFLFDLIYLWQHDALWYRVAFYGMAVGYAGALAAAVPGAIDFFLIVPSRRPVSRAAGTHAVLALSLLIVYAINLGLRLGPPASQGPSLWVAVGLSALGLGVLTATAWFGGELVFRYRIGVEEGG